MRDETYIAIGMTVLFAMWTAGSDAPWWAQALAAGYAVTAAFAIGRHVSASRIVVREPTP